MKVDVAVVGGGPAGLAVAIHAARHGLSTAVFERRPMPVDKACGEGLMPAGLEELERLGVRARLDPRGCAAIGGIRYLQEDGAVVEGRLPAPGGLGIRRLVLVSALEQVALEAGVALRARCRVDVVARGPERVTLSTTGGEVETRLLVAADGLGSPLRRAEGLDEPLKGSPRRFGLRQHFLLRPWSTFVEVHFAPGVEAYVTPAGAEQVGVAFLWEDGRLDGPISFPALLARFPVLVERLRGAPHSSEARGAGPMERAVKGRVLDRLVLVGDAAGYVDAITGEGLTLALRAAGMLGALLPEALARGATRAALAPYERRFAPEYARYARFARLLRALARRPAVRAAIIRRLAAHPALFQAAVRWVIR